jgi:hypothetical protein
VGDEPGLDYSAGTTLHALRAAIAADPAAKGEPPNPTPR